MTIDLSAIMNTIAAGLGLAGIIAGLKLTAALSRLEIKLESHEELDEVRHTELHRRIDHLN